MTSWSLVALAGILCATITVCWALWLDSAYSENFYDEPEPESEPEQDTQVLWPKEDK